MIIYHFSLEIINQYLNISISVTSNTVNIDWNNSIKQKLFRVFDNVVSVKQPLEQKFLEILT